MANSTKLILKVHSKSGWGRSKSKLLPKSGIAIVRDKQGEPPTVFRVEDKLTDDDLNWDKMTMAYEINIAFCFFDFKCGLPCKDATRGFKASLKVTCQVNEPDIVAAGKIEDAREAMEPLIIGTMEEISGNYDIENYAEVEKEIRSKVREADYGIGIEIKEFGIVVQPSDAGMAYITKKTEEEQRRLDEKQEKEQRRLDEEEKERKLAINKHLMKEGENSLLAQLLSDDPQKLLEIIELRRNRPLEIATKVKEILSTPGGVELMKGIYIEQLPDFLSDMFSTLLELKVEELEPPPKSIENGTQDIDPEDKQ